MMHSTPLIEIKNVTKIYDGHIALNDISLTIQHETFFSLLGGSGSGKSTLLRILSGLETPDSGQILLNGQDITHMAPYDRPINMMFQSYALFPHMTVRQNIAFGMKQDKRPKDEIEARCDSVLELVQMSKYAHRKPHQLSGGQQQRIALARCLAKRPKLILLDEPLSALDKKLRERMQFELVDIHEATGISFLMVTHDQSEAMTMSDTIAVMSEGYLLQVGTPKEIYEFPTNLETANFIGDLNQFQGVITVDEDHEAMISAEEELVHFYIDHGIEGVLDQQLTVAIRPEKTRISKRKPRGHDENKPVNCLFGKVEDIGYLGDTSVFHVRLKNKQLVKAMSFNIERDQDHPTWEDGVYLTWDPASVMVLAS